METKRNKRMVVVATIFTLLVVIGASYAYFTGGIKKEGDTTTTVETASLVSATAKFGGTIEANGTLPGYKVVKTINIKGGGSSASKPISGYIILTPNVVDFSNHVKYYIYEVEGDNPIDIADICEESKNTNTNNQYYDDMKCDTSSLGETILEGTFYNTTRVSKEITIEYNTNKTYYILVEYVNDTENAQDEEQGKKFTINIDADTEIRTATNQLAEIAKSSNELVYDETEDNNLRYIGANPNNYVLFNDELWRIIGVMNNIEDENGNMGSRIKLIRNESIGNYAWNQNYGPGDWSDSALMRVLNEGGYYNRTTDRCPYGANIKECDFSETGLNDTSKNMISNVVWHLGAPSSATGAREFYSYERGESVYAGRSITWTGKIGLMYPSDYGYATSGSNTTNIETCISSLNTLSDCYLNNWLYKIHTEGELKWTITADSLYYNYVYYVNGNHIAKYMTDNSYLVLPVVYLDKDIAIESGTGSPINPFILS